MAKTLNIAPPSLYGHPILPAGKGLTLTSQVREILLEEIMNGRWQLSERLPSVAALSEESGLSRWPIQEAFDQLEEEGYLSRSERSGTFLKSMTPEGRKPVGTIGVVILLDEDQGSWNTSPYSEYRLARVMAVAEKRHYSVKVKYLHKSDDWDMVDKAGGMFGPEVVGVISLHPCPHMPGHHLAEDQLPFVYFGGNTPFCLPNVTGDTTNGFYQLTREIITLGHTNIICFCDPADSPYELNAHLYGHQRAMMEAGLEVNEKAWRQSLNVREGDLSAIRSYLEDFKDATAIICMWGGMATPLVSVADMMGIRVPEDLSVTAHGASPLVTKPGQTMTSLEYDVDALIGSAVDLLREQQRHRCVKRTRVLGNPFINMGASLAPPRC